MAKINIEKDLKVTVRKWCEEHEGEDTVVITNSDGKKIFEATL